MKSIHAHGLIRAVTRKQQWPKGPSNSTSDLVLTVHSRKGLVLSTTNIYFIISSCIVILRDYKNT